jgi:2-C-methyl-D-erythritol 4-phosphate cytidylyltransferase/2-C-methyl-D-erythritol 2,4-cyclodiphosphate synthase
LILLAAGGSTRFSLPVRKQWLRVGTQPLWSFVADRFLRAYPFESVVIAAHPDEADHVAAMTPHQVVAGGSSREVSLLNALQVVKSDYVLVSDVARACVPEAVIQQVIAQMGQAACVVPVLRVVDTLSDGVQAIDRDRLVRVQTPQLSDAHILRRALGQKSGFTDESTLMAACGERVVQVPGDERALKLTFGDEIPGCLMPPSAEALIGQGFDVHAFEAGKPMVLCGVPIESPVGFKAHSDGDVALHALMDALLGAAGLGDIGEHFPDSESAYAGADSAQLLQKVLSRLHALGFVVRGVDVTIAAQTPRLAPHKKAMRQRLSQLLGLNAERVNLKATTTEKLGFIGRKEGVAAMALANLGYFDWRQR